METLAQAHQALLDRLGQLSDHELTRPATSGGGAWSAKDLLGHITFWEEIALETLAEWRAGKRPRAEDIFRAGDVDRVNAENFERKRDLPLEAIRAQAERTHRALLAAIEGTTDEEWNARAPYETDRRKRLGTLLGSVLGAPERPFGHVFAHLPDLEAYPASPRF
ncbi:MAG: DinB family protein [Candidatus Rokubacteria bacterium]|nr:DinB family protein [Candidatus Rokubacteria bacterium]